MTESCLIILYGATGDLAKRMVLPHHLAEAGDKVLIMAGVPFKTSGSTNVIHVVKLVGGELENYSSEG